MEKATEEIPMDADSSTKSLPDTVGDLLLLDSNGDAILAVGDPDTHKTVRFLISTKVLSLASPVFAKMFGPNFQEGRKILSGERVEINLVDDNATAMEVILKALHYYKLSQCRSVDAEALASIAVHCDKYDCTGALSPWISYWLSNVKQFDHRPEELGFLLLAAFYFDDAERFKEISAIAIRYLTLLFPSTWTSFEILNLLPENIQSTLEAQIQKMLLRIHSTTQCIEPKLRHNRSGFEMPRQVCMICGRTPPMEAKKCHPCNNSVLYQKYCTGESRVAEYFAILEKEELWPSAVPFMVCSLSELILRITCAKTDNKHSCAAEGRCPLIMELEHLYIASCALEEGVEGLCLHCAKGRKWDENQECTCGDESVHDREH